MTIADLQRRLIDAKLDFQRDQEDYANLFNAVGTALDRLWGLGRAQGLVAPTGDAVLAERFRAVANEEREFWMRIYCDIVPKMFAARRVAEEAHATARGAAEALRAVGMVRMTPAPTGPEELPS